MNISPIRQDCLEPSDAHFYLPRLPTTNPLESNGHEGGLHEKGLAHDILPDRVWPTTRRRPKKAILG
jgi:hypothetical protein